MKCKLLGIFGLLLLASCQESMDERCARECREYTEKKCPVLITEGVTIDSLIYTPQSRTLTYYFTAGGVLDNPEKLRQSDLRNMLLKELKNSTNMKVYKEAGYNFGYVYFSAKNKGTRLFEATFLKKDYQEKDIEK